DELCEDCQTRLDTNPLRILDCKIDSKKQFFKDAPVLMDYLEEDTKVYFNKVLDMLEKQNINYEVDNLLVRGLDYYNDTVFEFVCDNGKAQNTVIGGGRYDNLVKQLGGPSTPGFGFAMGIERLIDSIKALNSGIENDYAKSCDIVYMPLCEEAIDMSIISMNKLRVEGIRCETSYEVKSLKANFKQADRLKAVYAIIIGEDEIKNNVIIVKNLETKEETKISLNEFEDDIIKGDEHEKH
ncbi:MAG: His/Gly/Thr/Pro-type tRNA ligase C-terminal domain-containing protein, partial [Mycoplasmatales bacterium]